MNGDERPHADPIAEQVAYYQHRADEYDATAYDEVGAERTDERIRRVLDVLSPSGRALELACGTGRWTAPLAARVESLHALDAAPRALEIAANLVRLIDSGLSWSRSIDPG